jgi:ribosomal protein L28
MCGRKPQPGYQRSHSNVQTKKRQNLNLQSKKIGGKSVKLCSACFGKVSQNKKKTKGGIRFAR